MKMRTVMILMRMISTRTTYINLRLIFLKKKTKKNSTNKKKRKHHIQMNMNRMRSKNKILSLMNNKWISRWNKRKKRKKRNKYRLPNQLSLGKRITLLNSSSKYLYHLRIDKSNNHRFYHSKGSKQQRRLWLSNRWASQSLINKNGKLRRCLISSNLLCAHQLTSKLWMTQWWCRTLTRVHLSAFSNNNIRKIRKISI